MNEQEKKEAKVTVKPKPVVNEEVATEETSAAVEVAVVAEEGAEPVAGADLAGLTEMIAGFGGVQGLKDALAAITANAQSQRQQITARLLANRQNAFDAADLAKLDLAHLIKLDRTLTPANYGAQGGVAFNSATDDEWQEYQAPAVK